MCEVSEQTTANPRSKPHHHGLRRDRRAAQRGSAHAEAAVGPDSEAPRWAQSWPKRPRSEPHSHRSEPAGRGLEAPGLRGGTCRTSPVVASVGAVYGTEGHRFESCRARRAASCETRQKRARCRGNALWRDCWSVATSCEVLRVAAGSCDGLGRRLVAATGASAGALGRVAPWARCRHGRRGGGSCRMHEPVVNLRTLMSWTTPRRPFACALGWRLLLPHRDRRRDQGALVALGPRVLTSQAPANVAGCAR